MSSPAPSFTFAEETPKRMDLILRCGCEFIYESAGPSPIFLTLKLRQRPGQFIYAEQLNFDPVHTVREYEDAHGNIIHCHQLGAGVNRVRYDSLVRVSSEPENAGTFAAPVRVEYLPVELLRYTLPSRYCDSDLLFQFANDHFSKLPPGVDQVQGICDWVHQNIEYRQFSGSPVTTAHDTLRQGYGVCRDFAHLGVALCRCLNLPARYVTGYLPDIGVVDPGTPNDFHAYFQVWLGDQWHVFDARFNQRRIGRVHIAQGNDAVDGAFATVFGAVQWQRFDVWAYQIRPEHANLERPVDLADRLCGTTQVIISA
jgi:transglutaminase-like putative cysteine protease